MAFWEVVSNLYNVDYVIKVDDDSYVRLDRLSIAISQWSDMGAGEFAVKRSSSIPLQWIMRKSLQGPGRQGGLHRFKCE